MNDKAQELKSLQLHPGWKYIQDYVMNVQATKLNEVSKQGAISEDILKNIGGLDALRRFMGWVENSSKQDSEV